MGISYYLMFNVMLHHCLGTFYHKIFIHRNKKKHFVEFFVVQPIGDVEVDSVTRPTQQHQLVTLVYDLI